MMTILGAALGFASSVFPDVLSLFRERSDKKHELAILKLQMEQQRLGHEQRLEEIQINADVAQMQSLYQFDNKPTNTWVDGLRASVRPVITYGFFLLFVYVKVQSLSVLLSNGLPFDIAVIRLWGGETQALFSAIISFWFGHRTFSKRRQQGDSI